jgi:hypothetical protein
VPHALEIPRPPRGPHHRDQILDRCDQHGAPGGSVDSALRLGALNAGAPLSTRPSRMSSRRPAARSTGAENHPIRVMRHSPIAPKLD